MEVDRRQLYNDFVQRFPLGHLKDMPLEEYTNLNKEDSFCYWLEVKTQPLGSIWGGSAYKFGIFKYEQVPKGNYAAYSHDDNYTWYTRLGETAQEAYKNVRDAIVKTATLASQAKWEEIEKITALWPIVICKIAFMYSNEQLLPIYHKTKFLVPLAKHFGFEDADNYEHAVINRYIFKHKGDNDLYAYYDDLLSLAKDISNQENTEPKFWLFAPGENAFMWPKCLNGNEMRLGWDEISDLSAFGSRDVLTQNLREAYNLDYNPTNQSLALWQFANEMRKGDIVYAKKGMHKIIGRGVVDGDYEHNADYETYRHVRAVKWTQVGEWDFKDTLVQKTLTNISDYKDLIKSFEDLFIQPQPAQNTYSDADFLSEVYMSAERFHRLKELLKCKKNIVLQGAPGVGKTFTAERLAFAMMGKKDKGRVQMVQFHQNYSYEDFIMGYKPMDNGGFELKSGVFFDFCKLASESPDEDFFFIIDEINRGNLSKVFGELLMLIESGYRGKEIRLAYSGKSFYVPENLYIIGMMNTADRSLAMIDYALRRRFTFFDMAPGFASEGFKQYKTVLNNEVFDKVIAAVQSVNEVIAKDDSLGDGFCIGHSYFCVKPDDFSLEWLRNVVDFDIEPMLREYWFDDEQKFEAQIGLINDVLK